MSIITPPKCTHIASRSYVRLVTQLERYRDKHIRPSTIIRGLSSFRASLLSHHEHCGGEHWAELAARIDTMLRVVRTLDQVSQQDALRAFAVGFLAGRLADLANDPRSD